MLENLPQINAGLSILDKAKGWLPKKSIKNWLPKTFTNDLVLNSEALNHIAGNMHKEIICNIASTDKEKFHKMADACQGVMSILLNTSESLHCSIKVFRDDNDIFAIGRSQENKARITNNMNEQNKCHFTDNSAYASILGVKDKLGNDWSKTTGSVDAFIANQLTTRSDYHCSRHDWRQHYQSVAVFPMYKPHTPSDTDHGETKRISLAVGFLTFDSKNPNLFASLPDIFDNIKKIEVYNRALAKSAAFNIMSTMSFLICNAIEYDHKQKAVGV